MVETIDVRTGESDDFDERDLLAEAQRRIENLEIALHTSRRIGIAMGILMCRHRWTEDQAFGALREASQHGNRKLRDVAERVALTGDLP
jgi:AmiR/NasT family two-component response regulator